MMSFAPRCEKIVVGSCLSSRSSTYQVQSLLGQGAFGKVAACMRTSDHMKVAIKIMGKRLDIETLAKNEVLSLRKLRALDPDKCNIVRYYHSFVDREHICLVFEQLDQTVGDLMRSRNPPRLLLKEIRPIVQQVTTALNHLRTVWTIHADIKLDNVMLVNHKTEPYRVKLIDFGLSFSSPGVLGSYVQTRPYRSPESLLGLPFTKAIDMWSLGCMAAKMYLGTHLYPGRNEYEMMRCIVETQGLPPDHLLNLGCKTQHFFHKFYDPKASYWQLKSPNKNGCEMGDLQMATRISRLQSLDDLLHIRAINVENGAERDTERADVFMFVSMLKEMLQVDAARRITSRQVMQHNFISMDHITGLSSRSSYAKSCFDLMGVCRKNGVHRPIQLPTCLTSHPDTQRTSPPPSRSHPFPVDRDLSQAHFMKPLSCTRNMYTSAVKSGMKGKGDNEDGTMDETSHPCKRSKRPQAPPSSPPPPPPPSSTTPPVDRDLGQVHLMKTHPCTHNFHTSAVKSGMKRKGDNEDGTMDGTSHPRKWSKQPPAPPSSTPPPPPPSSTPPPVDRDWCLSSPPATW